MGTDSETVVRDVGSRCNVSVGLFWRRTQLRTLNRVEPKCAFASFTNFAVRALVRLGSRPCRFPLTSNYMSRKAGRHSTWNDGG